MNHGRHETHRIDAVALSKIAVSFAAILVFILLIMYVLWLRVVPPVIRVPQQVPAHPRLQATPSVDRMGLYRAQHEQLMSYGWVDEKARVAHIPIERAMALLAARANAQRPNEGTPR